MSNEIDAERIAGELHSIAIHLLRKVRREDEGSGLNAQRMSALSVIVFGGPMTLGDLAAAEQVRPPTMSRIVNALEEQGLVVRSKDGEDGRSTRLRATAAGRRLLKEGRGRRVRSLARGIEALSGAEKSTLRAAARILADVVREI